jgi:predicted HicB family RNase H-like nuclease
MINALQYKGYAGTIEFSADDDCFFGKIIGINDLVTFEGSSVEEIKTAFFEAVDDYLQMCREIGKEPDKAYKGSFKVRIDPALHQQAAMKASLEHISLNQFVESAIAEKVRCYS